MGIPMGIPIEIAPNIATEIARIKSGVSAAYTAVKNKGVTTSKTKIADLAGEISKIQTGKPEQEKSVTITANKTTTVLPDSGKTLSKVIITTNVSGGGGGGGGGYTVYFDSEWTGFYGSGRMGTVKFTHADGTEETSTDNNLNSASYSNVVSVTFTETEGESWMITYEVNGSSDNHLSLASNSTETLNLTGDTTFLNFMK